MWKIVKIIKGYLLPPKFKVGDIVLYLGHRHRISRSKYYPTHGHYFYWFEGKADQYSVQEKLLKRVQEVDSKNL
jgi:hypothetical protein